MFITIILRHTDNARIQDLIANWIDFALCKLYVVSQRALSLLAACALRHHILHACALLNQLSPACAALNQFSQACAIVGGEFWLMRRMRDWVCSVQELISACASWKNWICTTYQFFKPRSEMSYHSLHITKSIFTGLRNFCSMITLSFWHIIHQNLAPQKNKKKNKTKNWLQIRTRTITLLLMTPSFPLIP